jgi:uncharacterized protein YdhG (YjbR/CyaY superfamily)
MSKAQSSTSDVDEYIRRFPPDVQTLLERVRQSIKQSAQDATEKISYGIPTFMLNGNLVHFAAYKNHIGFYPGSDGIAHFEKELSEYESAKGSVRFPLDEPIPIALIEKSVQFRVKQNLASDTVKRRK